jgi:hypothetical protein
MSLTWTSQGLSEGLAHKAPFTTYHQINMSDLETTTDQGFTDVKFIDHLDPPK